ncbi:hypothetical protein [Aeromonas veronii]|uniref:hypothetical protein n=1 Tax=Aeromonas veronii TaxID=654 RepID=UPI000E09B587|nr:hypothetical protein [Aeromonas veronii]RDE60907.1 hypothetical protein DV708_16535 [Aeromonas veronii]
MKHILLVTVLVLALPGCDAVKELGLKLHKQYRADMGPMTFVFVPGYKVTVDGQTFSIFGKEFCPEAVTAKTFILGGGDGYPGQGSNACVVVHPGIENVHVLHVTNSGLVDEIWRVERDKETETVRLWTEDGKVVATAEQ